MRAPDFVRRADVLLAGRGVVRSVVLSGESAGRRLQRKRHREGRARALTAVDRDVALHQLRETAHDGKAKPGAAEAARGR